MVECCCWFKSTALFGVVAKDPEHQKSLWEEKDDDDLEGRLLTTTTTTERER